MFIDFFTNRTSLPLASTCNHCIYGIGNYFENMQRILIWVMRGMARRCLRTQITKRRLKPLQLGLKPEVVVQEIYVCGYMSICD